MGSSYERVRFSFFGGDMEQKEWNKQHAKIRAEQRYGVTISDEEYEKLVNTIIKGEIDEKYS